MNTTECVACGAPLPESMNCKYCGQPSAWTATYNEGNLQINVSWFWGGYIHYDEFGGIGASKPYRLLSFYDYRR
jgi:hypothetical protein